MTVSDSLGAADRAKRAEQVRVEGPVGRSTATARRYDCCTVSGRADGLRAAGWALVEVLRPGGLVLVARHRTSLTWDLGETHGTVAWLSPHPCGCGFSPRRRLSWCGRRRSTGPSVVATVGA